jgi:hypothetical protein
MAYGKGAKSANGGASKDEAYSKACETMKSAGSAQGGMSFSAEPPPKSGHSSAKTGGEKKG